MRIGYGFCPGRVMERSDKYLILAGVKVPWQLCLLKLGECDYDVLSRAAADALLGAMGLGSLKNCSGIDQKNTPGIDLLAHVAGLMKENGYCLCNMDIQLLIQDTRLESYVEPMKQALCAAVGCTPDQINLKLDPELWLGYTGCNQGIKATAVCLIE